MESATNGKRLQRLTLLASAVLFSFLSILCTPALCSETDEPYSPAVQQRYPVKVYWGDTHQHTNLSGDAVFRLGPDAAYRFAKGEEVESSTGQRARLQRPLDFIVLADHASNMGAQISRDLSRTNAKFRDSKIGKLWAEAQKELENTAGVNREQLLNGGMWPSGRGSLVVRHDGFRKSIWDWQTSEADRHNTPGVFTAFIGYEWTSVANAIHRVVVFRDNAEKVGKIIPFSTYDSPDPEKLWAFLNGYEKSTGGSVLAIPHNSNLTFGTMFALQTIAGKPLTREYSETRSYWEPIVEATQIKGDSETHPVLSPTDEFADFETWNGWAGRTNGGVMWTGNNVPLRPDSRIPYEYIRSALKLGLQQEAETGANPFKFGMIGSSDSHTGLSTVDENNFWGKTMVAEPSARRTLAAYSVLNWEMSAAGFAAVWAEENTREALFDAMRRREVYSTSGPRITVRFFGGWNYTPNDAVSPDMAGIGYAKGVPMGSDLAKGPEGKAPTFLLRAVKDPYGANLDRVQVIKGWRDADGKLHEKTYNVALSDGRQEDGDGKVEPVGNTVDLETATYTNSIGDPELAVVWKDPDFKATESAFYYLRVLEIPTPRWTAYDAKFYGLKDLPAHIPMITQDRAYTSPIWYTP